MVDELVQNDMISFAQCSQSNALFRLGQAQRFLQATNSVLNGVTSGIVGQISAIKNCSKNKMTELIEKEVNIADSISADLSCRNDNWLDVLRTRVSYLLYRAARPHLSVRAAGVATLIPGNRRLLGYRAKEKFLSVLHHKFFSVHLCANFFPSAEQFISSCVPVTRGMVKS
jgi:hypothetical protein